jgi:hypothetical protein
VLEELRCAVNLVQGDDQLAIAVTLELIAVLDFTFLSEAIVVVDFAVHDSVELVVFAVQGLTTSWG